MIVKQSILQCGIIAIFEKIKAVYIRMAVHLIALSTQSIYFFSMLFV